MLRLTRFLIPLLASFALVSAGCGGGSPDGGDVDVLPDGNGPVGDSVTEDDAESPPNALPLPDETKLLLTRRGAHSYVYYPNQVGEQATAVGPNLYWREFSDQLSHFGVYGALLKPLFEIKAMEPCVGVTYAWHASHAVRTYSCGQVNVIETTAYSSPFVVAVRFRLINTGGDTALTITGASGGMGVTASVEKDDALPGIRLRLDGQYASPWGDVSSAAWRFAAGSSPAPTSTDVVPDEGRWNFNYALPTDSKIDVVLTLSMAEGQDPSLELLDSPALYQVVGTVTNEIEEWLSEAPLSAFKKNPSKAPSWYLFWENQAVASGKWTADVLVPSKRQYFRGIWLWDTAFHVLALSRGGEAALALARKQLDVMARQPLGDGHLPREIWVGSANPGTQPPGVLTWASLALAAAADELVSGDGTPPGTGFLEGDYPALKSNHEWFKSQKDSDGDGLYEWAGTDSGWDTSPRWDKGPVEAVDLACWLYLDALLLSKMAEKLAKTADAIAWKEEADQLAELIRTKFYDAGDGLFYDLTVEGDQFVKIPTPVTYLPLFVGAATPEQAMAVVKHLSDPAVFGTPFPMPSVAASSPSYKPDNYWRGPVWIVLNALAVWGLEKYSLTTEAEALRKATLDLIEGESTTWEYYDSQTGKGLGAPDFLWSAAIHLLLSGDSPVIW